MTYGEAVLLGAVQGVTEFLPISSDGHLLLVEHFLGIKEDNVALNVALHAGTLMSILVVFWRDLLAAARSPRLCAAIAAATIPVVPVGLFLDDFLETTLNTPIAAGVGLLITAGLLFFAMRLPGGARPLAEVRARDGLVVGLFQCIAPAPGVSRSGSTISGGLITGLTREAAARFSFLIAVPAVGGALVLYSRKLWKAGAGDALGPVCLGAATAFVVGVASIHLLLRMVIRGRLAWCAWYCVVVGLGIVAYEISKR